MNLDFENKLIFNNLYYESIRKNSKAIFIDRDGVINEDLHYLKDPDKVKLCPGAKSLIRKIFEKNIPIIIVTNQSGISKNFLKWSDYHKVTNKILEELGNPNPITAIYSNSYKDSKSNNWRKPNPNMIIQASIDFNLNLEDSILIGDRNTDLEAGYRSGIKTLVHVKTGHGGRERDEVIKNFQSNKFLKTNINTHLIDNLLDFPLQLLN